jgi:hypothetical protein
VVCRIAEARKNGKSIIFMFGAHVTKRGLVHLVFSLLNACTEITRIQKLLGHQGISANMIYARVLAPPLKQTIAVLCVKLSYGPICLLRQQFWPLPGRCDT